MRSKDIIQYKSAAAVPKWMRDNAKRGLAWVKEKKAHERNAAGYRAACRCACAWQSHKN